MYVCMYVYIIYIHIHMCVCVCVRERECVCVCVCVFMQATRLQDAVVGAQHHLDELLNVIYPAASLPLSLGEHRPLLLLAQLLLERGF